MKESTDYNWTVMVRHLRHCVVLLNAIMSLAFLHYGGYLLYKIYNIIF